MEGTSWVTWIRPVEERDHHRIGNQPVPDGYIDSLHQYAEGRDALDTAYFSI